MEIEDVSIVMHFLIPVLVPTNDTRFPLVNIDEEKKNLVVGIIPHLEGITSTPVRMQ
jgi:hypothetical protein